MALAELILNNDLSTEANAADWQAIVDALNATTYIDAKDSAPRGWPYYRDLIDDAIGAGSALTLRKAVQGIANGRDSDDPQTAQFGINATSILLRMDLGQLPSNDSELRRALLTLENLPDAQVPPVVKTIAHAMRMVGYRQSSLAQDAGLGTVTAEQVATAWAAHQLDQKRQDWQQRFDSALNTIGTVEQAGGVADMRAIADEMEGV